MRRSPLGGNLMPAKETFERITLAGMPVARPRDELQRGGEAEAGLEDSSAAAAEEKEEQEGPRQQ